MEVACLTGEKTILLNDYIQCTLLKNIMESVPLDIYLSLLKYPSSPYRIDILSELRKNDEIQKLHIRERVVI